jgi:hypothetical protein
MFAEALGGFRERGAVLMPRQEVKRSMNPRERLRVTGVRFSEAPPREVATGLVGWISFELNDALRIDGCTLRRTLEGNLAISFPARRDRAGYQHFYVEPIDDWARREIEAAVFAALGLQEDSPR